MRSVRSQASGLPSPGMSLAARALAAANGPVAVPPRIIGAARDPPGLPPPSPKLPFLLFLSPLFLLKFLRFLLRPRPSFVRACLLHELGCSLRRAWCSGPRGLCSGRRSWCSVCVVFVSRWCGPMRSVRSQASGLPSPGMSLAAPAPAAANGPVAVPPRIIGAARDPPCPPPPSPKLPFLLFLSPLFLL